MTEDCCGKYCCVHCTECYPKSHELKTLKDIGIMGESVGYGKVSWDRNLIQMKDLRNEAIAWIKKLSTYSEISLCIFCFKGYLDCECTIKKDKYIEDNNYLSDYQYEASDIKGAIKILKHFFNITEDDLK